MHSPSAMSEYAECAWQEYFGLLVSWQHGVERKDKQRKINHILKVLRGQRSKVKVQHKFLKTFVVEML